MVSNNFQAVASDKINVVDATGRTLELSKLPQRLVIVGRGPYMPLHLLYTFKEGRERLVGVESKGNVISDFLPLVDTSFKTKTFLVQNPNVEQIASLKPDLVIMKGTSTNSQSESLDKIGIPTLFLALETPEQFIKDTSNLGIILGNEKRAGEVLEFYKKRLDRLRKGTDTLKDADKPRVLLIQYSNRGGSVAVEVPAESWMQTIEVKTAGGNPIWIEASKTSDGWTIVNFEQIAKWNPDKIFIAVWYALDSQKVINEIKNDPKWSTLKAVKNNDVYVFPRDVFGWDQAELRWILGMNWLATRMHPVLFKDIDMNAEVMAFFTQLYGMSMKDIETGILPEVKMDVH
jgi:iron complex transport system substrate-binding protein